MASTGFIATVKLDCPHSARGVAPVPAAADLAQLVAASCCEPGCSASTAAAAWICLGCMRPYCGRDANRHMLAHSQAAGHALCVSFADLSVWCYTCDCYVDDQHLRPMLSALHVQKFGEEMPGRPVEQAAPLAPAEPVIPTAVAAAAAAAAPPAAAPAEPQMFGVVPKTNCPHVMTSVSPVLNFELTDPCVSCGSTAENWVCLKCSQVLCSRYVAGHMAEHGETSGHPIVFSFSDFSFWCYACDSYITSPVLRPILSACHKAKFGSAAPQTPAGGAQPTGRSRLGVPEDTTEFFDDAATVRAKAHAVADMIRAARHVVVYTGAGISTSAKIPDYRGPQGVWTLRDQGKSASMPITLEQALPTRAHMALKALMDAGLVHYVVSTNVDGLHRRSGLAADQIAELHGNIYREVCATCKTEHLRLFDTTRNRFASLGHQTGRKCEQPGCDGDLCDTIIHFGENLPPIIEDAMRHAGQSDLAIVLGTSMRVAPACHLPTMAADAGHPMVIVNLQRTPYDGAAAVRCFARTDAFMDAVMERLGVAVPEFAGDAMSARGGDDAPSGDGGDVVTGGADAAAK